MNISWEYCPAKRNSDANGIPCKAICISRIREFGLMFKARSFSAPYQPELLSQILADCLKIGNLGPDSLLVHSSDTNIPYIPNIPNIPLY